MRLLVLGGTHFLGRHVATAALERGHDVATFTRGVSGEPPEIVGLTGHPTSPVHILDLGFVVPLMALAGLWLRRGASWGFVAAPVMLLKGVMVGLGLLAANLLAAVDDRAGDGPLNALWALISIGSAVTLVAVLRHVDDPPLV